MPCWLQSPLAGISLCLIRALLSSADAVPSSIIDCLIKDKSYKTNSLPDQDPSLACLSRHLMVLSQCQRPLSSDWTACSGKV